MGGRTDERINCKGRFAPKIIWGWIQTSSQLNSHLCLSTNYPAQPSTPIQQTPPPPNPNPRLIGFEKQNKKQTEKQWKPIGCPGNKHPAAARRGKPFHNPGFLVFIFRSSNNNIMIDETLKVKYIYVFFWIRPWDRINRIADMFYALTNN